MLIIKRKLEKTEKKNTPFSKAALSLSSGQTWPACALGCHQRSTLCTFFLCRRRSNLYILKWILITFSLKYCCFFRLLVLNALVCTFLQTILPLLDNSEFAQQDSTRKNVCVWKTWQGNYLRVLRSSALHQCFLAFCGKIFLKEGEAWRIFFFFNQIIV